MPKLEMSSMTRVNLSPAVISISPSTPAQYLPVSKRLLTTSILIWRWHLSVQRPCVVRTPFELIHTTAPQAPPVHTTCLNPARDPAWGFWGKHLGVRLWPTRLPDYQVSGGFQPDAQLSAQSLALTQLPLLSIGSLGISFPPKASFSFSPVDKRAHLVLDTNSITLCDSCLMKSQTILNTLHKKMSSYSCLIITKWKLSLWTTDQGTPWRPASLPRWYPGPWWSQQSIGAPRIVGCRGIQHSPCTGSRSLGGELSCTTWLPWHQLLQPRSS